MVIISLSEREDIGSTPIKTTKRNKFNRILRINLLSLQIDKI